MQHFSSKNNRRAGKCRGVTPPPFTWSRSSPDGWPSCLDSSTLGDTTGCPWRRRSSCSFSDVFHDSFRWSVTICGIRLPPQLPSPFSSRESLHPSVAAWKTQPRSPVVTLPSHCLRTALWWKRNPLARGSHYLVIGSLWVYLFSARFGQSRQSF